jgi:hypothetical protein
MMIINTYALNIGVPNIIKQTILDIKGQITPDTTIVNDFNTTLSLIDRSSKQKINKDTSELNCTINQMDLADI